MRFIKGLPVFLIFAAAIPVFAATRTITLNAPTMTCPVCPISVRKALRAVRGLDKVNIEYARKKVIVTYDDTKTNVAALTKATADVGYRSTPSGKAK